MRRVARCILRPLVPRWDYRGNRNLGGFLLIADRRCAWAHGHRAVCAIEADLAAAGNHRRSPLPEAYRASGGREGILIATEAYRAGRVERRREDDRHGRSRRDVRAYQRSTGGAVEAELDIALQIVGGRHAA